MVHVTRKIRCDPIQKLNPIASILESDKNPLLFSHALDKSVGGTFLKKAGFPSPGAELERVDPDSQDPDRGYPGPYPGPHRGPNT